MNNYSRTLFVFLMFFVVTTTEGQAPIKRKGGTTAAKIKTTNATKKTTTKTHVAKRPAANLYADSVAARPPKSTRTSSGIIELKMASGFTLYGKIRENFSDNAEAMKDVREDLSSCTDAKTGCLSDHKSIFIKGSNGYRWQGLSMEMSQALKSINKDKLTINDVCITDVGWWCVIYSNGNKYKGNIPEPCKKALDKYIGIGETILSVSISENGNHAIVTDKHYEASNEANQTALKNAAERFGHINSVCITNLGMLITCIRGILFWNVPKNVIDGLRKENGTPTVVRFTDSGTYMAMDGKGFKAFYM